MNIERGVSLLCVYPFACFFVSLCLLVTPSSVPSVFSLHACTNPFPPFYTTLLLLLPPTHSLPQEASSSVSSSSSFLRRGFQHPPSLCFLLLLLAHGVGSVGEGKRGGDAWRRRRGGGGGSDCLGVGRRRRRRRRRRGRRRRRRRGRRGRDVHPPLRAFGSPFRGGGAGGWGGKRKGGFALWLLWAG